MGKTRDLFNKTGTIKGTFLEGVGMIKDSNGMDLTELKRVRKGGKNTQKNYTKTVNDPGNHDDVVTHLGLDILESEVKWALGSITTKKTNGGDGIPAEIFQNSKR